MIDISTDTIQFVVNSNLCTGCGVCVALCPVEAISMKKWRALYVPYINHKKCVHCGICLQCCPGHQMDFKQLSQNFLGCNPENDLIGSCLNCYAGFSTDDEVRISASSGGIVTQLLIYALESGIIDGALVVRMSEKDPLEPEVFIARTADEIISSSKSKYCPVTINVGLQEICNTPGRYAVVGLPCHIHGLRKAQLINKKLSERIVLTIGLFCARATNFNGTLFFLKSIKVTKQSLLQIHYRGNGWPGGMTLVFKNGSKRFIPFAEYRTILGSLLFTPERCFLCCDALNELADISVGDAWLPQFRTDKKGVSIIVSRSKRGEDLLQQAYLDNKISITTLSIREIIKSQKHLLHFKKQKLGTRLSVWSYFGKPVPKYVLANLDSRFMSEKKQIPLAFFYYAVSRLNSRYSSLVKFLESSLIMFARFSLVLRRILIKQSSPYWEK